MARLMGDPVVTRIAEGAYRVEHDERSEIVYVAGSRQDQWAFWNGHVFRSRGAATAGEAAARAATGGDPVRQRASVAHSLTAPMPATVIKVLVTPGQLVRKGDTVIVLEAMKMELPVRAQADATVAAVLCREGELVQPDTTLVELK
jgi:biotin carboxyl carrier protein